MRSYLRACLLLVSPWLPCFAADVFVSAPDPGTTVSSPVHFVASSPGAVAMRIYADYQSVFLVDSDNIDTSIPLAAGSHHITVQSWEASGFVQKNSFTLNVSAYGGDGGVVVSAPVPGATVSSPVHFIASSQGSVAMRIYVDYQSVFLVDSDSLDTNVDLSSGDHHITVQAWNASGDVQRNEFHITVSGGGDGGDEHPDVSQIQNRDGWQSCDRCAGDGGDGPPTDHYMERSITSPSLSGSSAKYWLGGTSWGAALWWKQIGGRDDIYRFRYSLDFRVENPENAQALEFDMNQNAGGLRYIYGTECDFRGSHTWRVWNSQAHHWVSTGIGCEMPSPGRWNHLAWEFERTGGGVHFTSVTLNGERRDMDFWFPAYGEGGSGLDVAFQIDLNGSGSNVTSYLDNVGVTFR